MKNGYIFCLFLLLFSFSTVSITAQNLVMKTRSGVSTAYNNLDDALIDQQDGDYLTLSGGIFTISKAIIKGIHIKGAGYDTRTQATQATGFTRIIDALYVNAGADNGSIEGINFDQAITFGNGSTTTQLNGFLIKRCSVERIQTNTNCTISRLSIVNCITNYILSNSGVIQYSIVSNSLILQYFKGGSNSISNLFDHNIFFCESRGGGRGIYAYHCILTNNIFQVANFDVANYCVFQNNMNVPFPNGTNTITNPKNGETWDNTFQSLGATVGGWYSYRNDANYQLKSTSIGKNAATDGTDIGIYGGGLAWKEYGIPSNPHISAKNISSNTNPATGKLHVEITATAQSN
jgi:hypothetical protein